MQKKVALRFVIGIVVILALFFGYRMLKEFTIDPDMGDFESVGYILALKSTDTGTTAVLFDPDESEIVSPQPEKERFEDTEATWSADGQRVFLSSNRESTAYNIYRWNPAKDKVDRRSEGSLSQSAPWFSEVAGVPVNDIGLITSGGNVLEYNPTFGTSEQLLPPTGKGLQASSSQSGAISSMEAVYGNIGDSFRTVRYGPSRQDLFAVMRSPRGEVLIYSSTVPDAEGRLLPQVLQRAQKLDISTSSSGVLGMMIRGFMFPDPENIPAEFLKNGRPVPPFLNGIMRLELVDGQLQQVAILLSQDITQAYGDIAVSPDGEKIAVVIGAQDKAGKFTPQGLIVMPFATGGAAQVTPLDRGDISTPSWSRDSSKLVYIKTEEDNNNIYAVAAVGGMPDQIGDDGLYSQPRFSPQAPQD